MPIHSSALYLCLYLYLSFGAVAVSCPLGRSLRRRRAYYFVEQASSRCVCVCWRGSTGPRSAGVCKPSAPEVGAATVYAQSAVRVQKNRRISSFFLFKGRKKEKNQKGETSSNSALSLSLNIMCRRNQRGSQRPCSTSES